MTGASYVPGTWLGIVRSGTAVLLGPETPAELAGAIWELLGGQPEPHEVLAAVTSRLGWIPGPHTLLWHPGLQRFPACLPARRPRPDGGAARRAG
ncbi:hypothetical protein NG819_18320 [Pseudarthrobacter sp. Fe7]|nr:hypothetical protein NG819_18320 [Pseudarthrobacter sp. Fe7]